MGGCRCVFQTCQNSSANNAGMHFFRFPWRDAERLEKWATFAKAPWVLELDNSQIKNKVVCEEHFRDECFMNYLKDRLVATAIPTLMRLPQRRNGKELVLDFEFSSNPKPKVLPPPTQKHLIPPTTQTDTADDANLGEIEEDEDIEDIMSLAGSDLSDPEREMEEILKASSLPPPRAEVKVLKRPMKTMPPKILNKKLKMESSVPNTSIQIASTVDEMGSSSMQFILSGEDYETNILCPISEDIQQEYDLLNNELEDDPVVEDELLVDSENTLPMISQEVYDNTVTDLCDKIQMLQDQLEQQKLEAVAASKKAAMEMEALKKSLQTQVEAVSTSKSNTTSSAAAPPAALTKAQLYNGLKKYLCPSMATLVRMEMFGGPERDWKPDERELTVDLLKLGDNVFAHFRDEWRVRIPPKKDALQWLTASNEIVDDEDL